MNGLLTDDDDFDEPLLVEHDDFVRNTKLELTYKN
jgi:hypothetical protein